METNVHRRDYDSNNLVKGSAGLKYRNIIKHLTEIIKNEPRSLAIESAATSKGLRKIATDYPVECVYYHNPKDLKYRYRVLMGEINAGNSDPLKYNKLVNIQISLCKTKKIGKKFVNWAIDNVPVQLHKPGYNYLGPGTHNLLNQEKKY